MIEIKGKSGIVAKILADSVNEQSNRLTTFELTYPRMVHSEILTHKMLCSNSASSRAIPFAKMVEQLTAMPVRFGQANPGMQDKGEGYDAKILGDWDRGDEYIPSYQEKLSAESAWNCAKTDALKWAKRFNEAGYHKQVYNRLTEPFQMMKTVISGTEWDNFFWLRYDYADKRSAVDPTLHELARCMQEARDASVPQLLKTGEYHLPYITVDRDASVQQRQLYFLSENDLEEEITLDQAIKVSCARTAAVSFRNKDYGLEKCLEVYARLIGDERKHASAMQHAATPMRNPQPRIYFNGRGDVEEKDYIEDGVSHIDLEGNAWSAQYKGFVMHRKTIPGENYVNG